jgi:GNAT superfamily N-acetyltransferase
MRRRRRGRRQTVGLTVVEIPVAATYDLRRRVLRDGRDDLDLTFPEDVLDGAFHLGVERDGAIVAIGSFAPSPTPLRPGVAAFQLRGMAVDTEMQGGGLGRMLLEAAEARLRAAGIRVVWANARDSALGFYVKLRWLPEGDGFRHGYKEMPHHVVVRDLSD